MKAIVNVNMDWAIGKNNNLINKFSEDMKFFKSHTLGNTVIYGRKTLDSFPNKAPLPNRKNIVLTSNTENIKNSIDKCDCFIDLINSENANIIKNNIITPDSSILISSNNVDIVVDISNILGSDVYVCGGETVYKQFLKYCDMVYVTMCYNHCDDADAFFPNLDNDSNWKIVDRSGTIHSSKNNIDYEFIAYHRCAF